MFKDNVVYLTIYMTYILFFINPEGQGPQHIMKESRKKTGYLEIRIVNIRTF